MQFSEKDIEGVRNAIEGLGAEKVYALAMALQDGVIQVQILKHIEGTLQTIALAGHPFYTTSWDDVNQFLDTTFVDRPSNVMRVSDWAGFNQRLLMSSL